MTTIYTIANDFVERYASQNPVSATGMGVPGHDDRMSDYSPDGSDANAGLARDTVAALEVTEPENERDRIAKDVMLDDLRTDLDSYDAGEHLRNLRVLGSPLQGLRMTFDLMPRDTEEQWRNIASRLNLVPEGLAGYRRTLDEGLSKGTASSKRQATVCAKQAQTWIGANGKPSFFHGLLDNFESSGISNSALQKDIETGAKAAAQAFIPAMLELGGKDPAIVLESADLEAAAHSIMRGSIVNCGQACFATERIYVEYAVYDAFVEKLCSLAGEIEINYPDIRQGHIGPFIFSRQAEIVQNQLDDAVEKGAKVMTGGTIENHEGGQWLRPTIIVNVDHGMQIMREETFGPVLPVMRVGSVDEAVSLANDTSYGLSAAVFGAEQDAEAVAARVDAGGIFINDIDLVGEVGLDAEKNAFKCSGLGGSRYGPDGILRFVRKKAIVHRHDKPDEISSLAGINT